MDVKQMSVVKFFAKVNPKLNLKTSLRLRHPLTGLCGIPGAGKTVLCGAIVENVLQDSDESIAVAYFFCDYKSRETQQIEVILGSLAAQIALQNSRAFEHLEEYYDELHQKGELENPVETDRLIAVIQEMASQFGKLYIVVDALDECGVETYNIAEALKELVDGAKSINLAN
ncbi:putative ankyrin repeat protein [Eutypa lata UCREL1]|uniref:Putative ankyrin repeat protein n=1 Tax=Eutypa lata (strain UCR-EL1) TaxID=1287681 RepID=M7T454_EUTLA|nr:putative ankyrin repeat protein [Eutypa lata UCREL1]